MPDYQKGKIYKLWSPQGQEDEIYIGSTCNKLRYRKNQHKKDNRCNSKILFEKYDDVRIELIEEYSCNSKAELNKKEGEHIRANKCLNERIEGRTKKEWREENKEYIAEKHKKYRKNNKEKLREKAKEYYQNNKEKKKEYRENNKEHKKEYLKQYYKDNKEKRSQKVTCDCGCIISKDNLARHQKSKKHLELMND